MKKRVWCLALALILAVSAASTALGAGGDEDPVAALSYVSGAFTKGVQAAYTAQLNRQMGQAYRDNLLAVTEAAAAQRLADLRAAASTPRKASGRIVCRQGDVLTLAPGCKATLLSGTAEADTSYLVDVTRGRAVGKGSNLAVSTLYMMGDTTSGELRIRSAACELTLDGVYRLAPGSGTDYGSLADALSQMGLFRGMTNGYNLEAAASRIQGLVMFLRILGLEEEAAAYTGSCPFRDVPKSHWGYRYVAYAYNKGLTTGTSSTAFSPDSPITCQHYATFLLRALHYSEGGDFSYNTAVGDLTKLGLFTQAETGSLSAGVFYRFKMVYLSFYGLYGVDQETGSLLMNSLTGRGAVPRAALAAGLLRVSGGRIGG